VFSERFTFPVQYCPIYSVSYCTAAFTFVLVMYVISFSCACVDFSVDVLPVWIGAEQGCAQFRQHLKQIE